MKIVTRKEKQSALTWDELDENFNLVQNLKGTVPPDVSIGQDGDYYTLYEHLSATIDDKLTTLLEYSSSNSWLYSNTSGTLNGTVTGTTITQIEVSVTTPDILKITFADPTVVTNRYLELFNNGLEYTLNASDLVGQVFTVNIPGVYSTAAVAITNGTLIDIRLREATIVKHKDYLKKMGVWYPFSNVDLIKNSVTGFNPMQQEVLDATNALVSSNTGVLTKDSTNNGIYITGRNTANYGPIGSEARDFSFSDGWIRTDFGATGRFSFAEGQDTTASGDYSHAEGQTTIASGDYSHTEGYSTKASGAASHASGHYTIALNDSSFVAGMYNVGTNTNTILEIGIGSSTFSRSNALEIFKTGEVLAPSLTTSLITDPKSLVTKEFIDNLPAPVTDAFKVVSTLPAPSLALFEKSRYDLSQSLEFICIANTTSPTTDAECFWVQR